MQVIFEDEDEGSDSRRTSSMDPLIYIGRISERIEEERDGGIRDRRNRV